jgi:endoglucanase
LSIQDELFLLLKKLSELNGISGFEDEVRGFVADYVKMYADEAFIDSLGNVIAIKKGGDKKFMVAAHMDEIGLVVKFIDDKGFIRFTPVGGWNERILPGTRVKIKGRNGWVPGVIGVKPPHLMKPEEAKQVLEIKDLYIDVGASSRDEVLSLGIENGSPIVLDVTTTRLFGSRVTGKAFDDRSGLTVALKSFADSEPRDVSFVLVATVQEEVGLKGAKTSAYGVSPDVALALDVTTANDVPGVDPQDAVVKLGAGPAVKIMDGPAGRGMIANQRVLELLKKVAVERNIPIQAEVLPGGTTDASIIQLNKEGVPAGVISIPSRYIHSGVEMIDLKDLENAYKLLLGFYESLTPFWIDSVKLQKIK